LTTEAIKEGFNNLKPAANYDNLYYAAFREPLVTGCYECYPLVYGYMVALSRYYLLTCTNPTLAMVVDRFKEIENFKPNPIGNCKPCTEKRCLIMMMVDF
jgi:DNA topoisomerase-3